MYSDPFTSRIKFKFTVNNNNSYISICFDLKENPTSRVRDNIKKVVLLRVLKNGSNSPSSVARGGLEGLTRGAPGGNVECQIPFVALNGVLEGKVADALGVDSELSGRGGERHSARDRTIVAKEVFIFMDG